MQKTLIVVGINLFLGISLFATRLPPFRIVGCYSDLKLIVAEGLVVGNGSLNIKKLKGKYVATFTELTGDGGEYAPTVRVRNLSVNESKRTVKFDLPLLGNGKSVVFVRGVTGRITSSGIRMNWRGRAGEFGGPNPFLRRRSRECT